ncbi:type II secretion system F family protein [Egicoccus sp. AB-alg2]|uniref:type II secretion system F family protein n=1 Tax=Egicoccus sp. AB-alg2 TaxID=3242693 RepID=UPI00359D6E3F
MSAELYPLAVLGATALALVVLLLGVWQLVLAWTDRSLLERRSELERVELEASRVRYRLNARLQRTALGRQLGTSISRAGVDLAPLDLLALYAVAVLTGFVLLNVLGPLYLGVVGGVVGWFAVRQWLEGRRRARIEEFVAQLPEFARTLSNATSAGRSLHSALQLAANELDEPAATELRLVSEQLRIGASVDDALETLKRRLPSRELAVLVSTLVIQQRTGGDVVTALRDMAETLETRKDLRREVRTIVSGAVQTGYVTGGMGLGLILLMNVVYGGMIDAMARRPLGQLALLVAASLYALAFVLVRRMTRIDV